MPSCQGVGVGLAAVGFVALRQWKGGPPVKPGDAWEARDAGTAPDAPRRGAPAGVRLPCLNSHNSNEHLSEGVQETDEATVKRLLEQARKVGGSAAKTAFALRENIVGFVSPVRLPRCAFVTLSFGGGGEGPSCAYALKKFNSFLTGWISKRWPGGFRILERGEKKGRVHLHLLVDTGRDIRTGVDVEAVQKGDYSSASAAMREEYSALRRAAKAYGFGFVVNLQPVKSCDQAIAKYLSKYVAKHLGRRELRDKRVRLVGYWGHAAKGRTVRAGFQFKAHTSRLWRWQLAEFAKRNGCADMDELKEKFGCRWAYHHESAIRSIEPPSLVVAVKKVDGENDEWVTLWDVWTAARIASADRIARATGQTQAAVYMALYQPGLEERLERAVSGFVSESNERYLQLVQVENVRHASHLAKLNDEGEAVDRCTVWADGRVERLPS